MYETERISVPSRSSSLLSSLHCLYASPTSPSGDPGANEGPFGKYGENGIKEGRSVRVEESDGKTEGLLSGSEIKPQYR